MSMQVYRGRATENLAGTTIGVIIIYTQSIKVTVHIKGPGIAADDGKAGIDAGAQLFGAQRTGCSRCTVFNVEIPHSGDPKLGADHGAIVSDHLTGQTRAEAQFANGETLFANGLIKVIGVGELCLL